MWSYPSNHKRSLSVVPGHQLTREDFGQPVTREDFGHPITTEDFGHPITGEDFGQPVTREILGQPITREDFSHPITRGDFGHNVKRMATITELFQKNEYDFNACNNVRDILYNTDVINYIVKLLVRSPVGKLV